MISQGPFQIDDIFSNSGNPSELFKIIKVLTPGGFGYTYIVKKESTNEKLVAKLPKLQGNSNDQYIISKQLHEATMLKELKDKGIKNIVVYHDSFETNIKGLKVPVLLTEFAEGDSLSDFLKNIPDHTGCIDEEMTKKILLKIVEPLQEVQKLGIIHRDIKPDNIIIKMNGTGEPDITILDFGISANFDNSNTFNQVTPVGTPFFASPELIINGIITYSSDVFSLGATAFNMMTGKTPTIQGEYNTKLHLPPGKTITDEFNEIIKKATAPDYKDRIPLVSEFGLMLEGRLRENEYPRLIIDGVAFPLIFENGKDIIAIGRSAVYNDPDIEINERSSPEGNYYISRQQCIIKRDANGVMRLFDGGLNRKSANNTMFHSSRTGKWFPIKSIFEGNDLGIILGTTPFIIGLGYSEKNHGLRDCNGNIILPGVYRTIEYRPPDSVTNANKSNP